VVFSSAQFYTETAVFDYDLKTNPALLNSTFGYRSFSVFGPRIWNGLPQFPGSVIVHSSHCSRFTSLCDFRSTSVYEHVP